VTLNDSGTQVADYAAPAKHVLGSPRAFVREPRNVSTASPGLLEFTRTSRCRYVLLLSTNLGGAASSVL
jgi:hypothetical protein